MDKNKIKKFAQEARTKLLLAVKLKASQYNIDGSIPKDKLTYNSNDAENIGLGAAINDQKRTLVEAINKYGYDQVFEEVAYSWFNRFCAIRYMEVNNYLPDNVRVFSDSNNNFYPEILKEGLNLDFVVDKDKIRQYLVSSQQEQAYRELLIDQCNYLGKSLPGIFNELKPYTKLLFPDNLLKPGSILESLVSDIEEEDWKEGVQIIGWLYQYYNIDLKNKVYADLKKNIKITKDTLPAVTQLFTPDWIVRYMVENSLGKLWIESQPTSPLKDQWKYYLPEAEQEPAVAEALAKLRQENKITNPEQIKCIDPCMGSGHILCYLFDVLLDIYNECGYTKRDAARAIVENNLYGLDIDKRAFQLAYFSVMMKGRAVDRRFLERGITPHVYEIPDITKIDLKSHTAELLFEKEPKLLSKSEDLLKNFENSKDLGSIISLPEKNYEDLYNFLENELAKDTITNLDATITRSLVIRLHNLIDVAHLLGNKFDIVITNPPYMGSSSMGKTLASYLKKKYPDSKSDLFAVFIERCMNFTKPNGFLAMITMHSFMFLSSYEKLRAKLFTKDISTLVHLGTRAFEDIGGEVVQTATFTIQNRNIKNYVGTYLRLVDGSNQDEKENLFLSGNNRYLVNQNNFAKIPGSPIAYWASDNLLKAFEKGRPMGELLDVRQGLATGCNEQFLREWWEVSNKYINTSIKSIKEYYILSKDNNTFKYVFYNKGGRRRQWYGNYDYVCKFDKKSYEILLTVGNHLPSKDTYFKEAITWSDVATGQFAIRYRTSGGIHDVKGMSAFLNESSNIKNMYLLLGLVGTKISNFIFKMLNPTISLQVGNFKSFPVLDFHSYEDTIYNLVMDCIFISKLDWDMHETSWDFKSHPFIGKGKLLDEIYPIVKEEINQRFARLKANEEELNRIFIDIYGLGDELTPEVADKDITVAKVFDSAEEIDDEIKGNRYVLTKVDLVKSLLSYAIGCAFGRYKLNHNGLFFAGGQFRKEDYDDTDITVDADNILPITLEKKFPDDITVIIDNFLTTAFGEESLESNLKFIADTLGNKNNRLPRDVIRDYFVKDFYKDHLAKYQKHPIYWQLDAGKLGSFKALFYLHRYDKNTMPHARNNYVLRLQDAYRRDIEEYKQMALETTGKTSLDYSKKVELYTKLLAEITPFEEKMHIHADSTIELDLDKGVKENYKLFEDVLTKLK